MSSFLDYKFGTYNLPFLYKKISITCNAWFDFGFQNTRINSEKSFFDRQQLKSTQLLGQWFKGRYNTSGVTVWNAKQKIKIPVYLN